MSIQKNLLFAGMLLVSIFDINLSKQNAFAQEPISADQAAEIAAVKTEMDQAIAKVKVIINQPVTKLIQTAGIEVSVFSPGWFHEGAIKPDFITVDVRQSQEFPYDKHQFVSSDLNKGYVFSGRQLEFNSMTKYFYVDRSLPKKKLTESEMIEINRLYRIIGRCEQQLHKLTRPPAEKAVAAAPVAATDAVEVDDPDALLVRQPVPKENYVKAAIGVSLVLVLYALYRKFR